MLSISLDLYPICIILHIATPKHSFAHFNRFRDKRRRLYIYIYTRILYGFCLIAKQPCQKHNATNAQNDCNSISRARSVRRLILKLRTYRACTALADRTTCVTITSHANVNARIEYSPIE